MPRSKPAAELVTLRVMCGVVVPGQTGVGMTQLLRLLDLALSRRFPQKDTWGGGEYTGARDGIR